MAMAMAGTGSGRNIGVAVDFSSCSKNALRWAAANLAAPGDRLILIHVKTSYQYEQGVAHLWEHDGSRTLSISYIHPYIRHHQSPQLYYLSVIICLCPVIYMIINSSSSINQFMSMSCRQR